MANYSLKMLILFCDNQPLVVMHLMTVVCQNCKVVEVHDTADCSLHPVSKTTLVSFNQDYNLSLILLK